MDAKLEAALRELTDRVMGRPGVTGTAIGRHCWRPCLVVYISDAGAGKGLPRKVGGFRVVAKESGRFRRL